MRSLLLLFVLASPALAQEDAGVVLAAAPDAGQTPLAAPLSPAPAPAEKGVSLSAKFGSGVTVRSGDFSLTLRGRVQILGLAVVPSEGSSALRQNDLMVRRARLQFKGEGPYKLSFTLQLAFASQDMEPDAPNVLRDFYVEWKPLRDLSLRLGQGKVPFGVQRIVSSSAQEFVDRSTVTGEFNLDRDVGVTAFSNDLLGLGGRVRYALGVFGGDGRNRAVANNGLLFAARVRLSNVGWDDKYEGDLERDSRFRVALGGSVSRNNKTNRPRSTIGTPYQAATFNYTHAGADLHVKWHGADLLSEFFWRQADENSQTHAVKGADLTEYSRSGLGWFVQGGYYATSWLQFVARYGEIRPAADTDPHFGRSRELGGGVNFMVQAHDLKVQADYFWLDDGQGHNGRHQVRLQLQLYF